MGISNKCYWVLFQVIDHHLTENWGVADVHDETISSWSYLPPCAFDKKILSYSNALLQWLQQSKQLGYWIMHSNLPKTVLTQFDLWSKSDSSDLIQQLGLHSVTLTVVLYSKGPTVEWTDKLTQCNAYSYWYVERSVLNWLVRFFWEPSQFVKWIQSVWIANQNSLL